VLIRVISATLLTLGHLHRILPMDASSAYMEPD